MVIIKKSKNNICWQGCIEKETLIQCLRENKLVQPSWKVVWGLLKGLKTELQFHPVSPLLGILPKQLQNPYIIKTHECICSWQHY